MDLLSRDWKTASDGLSRIEWAKNRTKQWFQDGRREKIERRWKFKDESIEFDKIEKIKILDVGSCNGQGFPFVQLSFIVSLTAE